MPNRPTQPPPSGPKAPPPPKYDRSGQPIAAPVSSPAPPPKKPERWLRVANEHHSMRDGDSLTIETQDGQVGVYFNSRGAIVVTGNARMAVQTVGFGSTNRGCTAPAAATQPTCTECTDIPGIRCGECTAPSTVATVRAAFTAAGVPGPTVGSIDDHRTDAAPYYAAAAANAGRLTKDEARAELAPAPDPFKPIIGDGPFTADQVCVVVGQVYKMLHSRFNKQLQERLATAAKLGTGPKIFIGLTWLVAAVALGLFAWQRLGGR